MFRLLSQGPSYHPEMGGCLVCLGKSALLLRVPHIVPEGHGSLASTHLYLYSGKLRRLGCPHGACRPMLECRRQEDR